MTPEEAFMKATKVRAKAYIYLYEELVNELGEEKTAAIFSRAIYRLGEDGSSKFSEEARVNPVQLGEEFCGDSVSKNVFDKTVLESDANHAKIEMKNCPLVNVWKEMGQSEEMIKKMCDIAHKVDYGTIEALGYKLSFLSRLAHNGKSCILDAQLKK